MIDPCPANENGAESYQLPTPPETEASTYNNDRSSLRSALQVHATLFSGGKTDVFPSSTLDVPDLEAWFRERAQAAPGVDKGCNGFACFVRMRPGTAETLAELNVSREKGGQRPLVLSQLAKGYRNYAHIAEVTAIGIDYDGDPTQPPNFAPEAWPCDVYAHSTHNYDAATMPGKWRVILPLKTPIPIGREPQVRKALAALLPAGAILRAPHQPAFLPTCPEDKTVQVAHVHQTEIPAALDWTHLIDMTAPVMHHETTGDVANGLMFALFEEAKMVRDGGGSKVNVECPWKGRHKTGGDLAFLYADVGDCGRFSCAHTECAASRVGTPEAFDWFEANLPEVFYEVVPLARVVRVPAASPEPEPAPEEPVPEAPAEFPIEALPKAIQIWMLAMEETHRAPRALIGTAALGAMSAAVQGNVTAEVTEGYATPLGLYAIVAAAPGAAKSPVFRAAFAPLEAWERETAQALAPGLANGRAEKAKLEQERGALLRQLGQSNKPIAAAEAKGCGGTANMLAPAEVGRVTSRLGAVEMELALLGNPPKEFRYFVEDATPQSLVPLFAQHGRLALVTDEGQEAFNTATGKQYEQAGGGGNMHVLLKAYDGDGVAVDRKGKDGTGERICAGRANLALCIAVQPDVLGKIVRDPEASGRGLLDRCLVVLCGHGRGYASKQDRSLPMPGNVRDDYARMLTDMARETGTKGATPEAQTLFQEFKYRVTKGGRPQESRDTKAAWRAVRIAGILACANRESAISGETMSAAITLCDWFETQWELASGRRPDDTLLEQIVAFVAEQPNRQATGRQIQKRFKRQIGSAKRMRELLADAATFGLLEVEELKAKQSLLVRAA